MSYETIKAKGKNGMGTKMFITIYIPNNFISNFLSEREFNVRVNSTYSDIHVQEMGVPPEKYPLCCIYL
jgi:hypothetical protein